MLDDVFTSGKHFKHMVLLIKIIQHGIPVENIMVYVYSCIWFRRKGIRNIWMCHWCDRWNSVRAGKKSELGDTACLISSPFPIGVWRQEMRIQLSNQEYARHLGERGRCNWKTLFWNFWNWITSRSFANNWIMLYTTGIAFQHKEPASRHCNWQSFYFNYSLPVLIPREKVYGVMNTGQRYSIWGLCQSSVLSKAGRIFAGLWFYGLRFAMCILWALNIFMGCCKWFALVNKKSSGILWTKPILKPYHIRGIKGLKNWSMMYTQQVTYLKQMKCLLVYYGMESWKQHIWIFVYEPYRETCVKNNLRFLAICVM